MMKFTLVSQNAKNRKFYQILKVTSVLMMIKAVFARELRMSIENPLTTVSLPQTETWIRFRMTDSV